MRYGIISCILLIFIFSSCEKQSNVFIYMSINPDSQYEIKNSGELIDFTVTISSSSNMSELFIIQTINNSVIDTLESRI